MQNAYNFPVEVTPVQALVKVPEGITLDVAAPKYRAVVRTDSNEVLGVVSNKYELLKHETVIDGFRNALKGVEVEEKIHVLKNGAQLLAHYKLVNDQIEVKPGDFVALQIVVKNSYDGSNALQIMLGAFRLVCSNGMIVGKSFYNYSQKHIGQGLDVERLNEKIKLLSGNFRSTTLPDLQAMTQKQVPMSVEAIFDYNGLTLPHYLVDEAKKEFERANDNSVWGYYNSLTYAITHSMKKNNPEAALKFGKVAWEKAKAQLV